MSDSWHRGVSVSDLAWAAGLFEGEGSVFLVKSTPALSLTSTDLDVVERFKAIVGVGCIRARKHRPEHKLPHEWRIGNFHDIQAVIAMLWRWLGARRRARATECLLVARAGGLTPRHRRLRITECPQGHPFDVPNTYVTVGGDRVCRACRNASVKRWHQKVKARAFETAA